MSRALPKTADHKRERYVAQNLGRALTARQLRRLRKTAAADERRAIKRKARHASRAKKSAS